MVIPTGPPAAGSARMRSDQPPSVASVDRVRRALPSGFQPWTPPSKLALASRLRGPGGDPPALAAVVATAATVVVGAAPALAAVDAVGRAAARPLEPWRPPLEDPTQANPVTTSSTASPRPVQTCHRRCRGGRSARWRGM